jgi:uncharacterized alpha-E superfamily protein
MLSRVADSLYWMSRYLERAEHTARLIGVHLTLSLDQAGAGAQRWRRMLASLRAEHVAGEDAFGYARSLTFDMQHEGSVVACIAQARENARQVREQISTEMWEQINRLYLTVRAADALRAWDDEPLRFYQAVKEGAQLFQGVTDSTMTHGEGWRYISLGRYLERAMSLAALLDVHCGSFPQGRQRAMTTDEYFEWLGLLKSCTAWEAYCKVYSADLLPDCIVEFLLLNNAFPHSVHFAIERVQHALDAIADLTGTRKQGRVHRLAGRLLAQLSYAQIDEVLSENNLHTYLREVQESCGAIHDGIYAAYVAYAVEAAL